MFDLETAYAVSTEQAELVELGRQASEGLIAVEDVYALWVQNRIATPAREWLADLAECTARAF